MSRARLVRRLLVGGLLFAIAVQIGVFFALREKKKRAQHQIDAGITEVATASAPLGSDAGPITLEVDAAVDASVPIDASTVVAAVLETETPRERRRRERLEAKEAAAKEKEQQRVKRERDEAERKLELERAKSRLDAGPEALAVTTARVTFRVSPAGAALNLDANFIGNAPLRPVQIPAGKHTLAVSASGYAPATATFTVRARQKKTIKVTLRRAPKVTTTTEPTVAKRPSTPRVSGTSGSASRGRGLLGSKCNGCHRSRGVGGVGPRSRRRASWGRFFAGGYHDRYERIGGLVSRTAMADIKAYLMENAKCDSNTAGAKCND